MDSFTYNGDGQRVQKQDSTGTTNHVWDGQNILLETNASNIIQVVYTLEPLLYGNLISQSRSGVDSFYLFDALGSTRQLANPSGSVTDVYSYDGFGDSLASSGATTNPFRYIGRLGYYYDPDPQTYHVRSRVYQPANGRFLSRDRTNRYARQVLLAAPLIAPRNRYAYADSNPLSYVDPSGYQSSGRIPAGFPPGMKPPPPGFPPVDFIPVPPYCACEAANSPWGYLWDSPGGTPTYPYEHCLWNCTMVALCGGGPKSVLCSWILSWNKEVLDLLMCYLTGDQGDCDSAFQPSDFRDNRTGREFGADCANKYSCYPVFNIYNWWEWLPSYRRTVCCIINCELSVPQGTPEGPGTGRPFGPVTGPRWPTPPEMWPPILDSPL